MRQKNQTIKPCLKESYLTVIKNSAGTKLFQNFYLKINNRKQDILKNGELSCAFFVSSILIIFGLIKKIHCTVSSTIKDLKKSGWKKSKKVKIGSVIIWEEKQGHQHIGFYIGKNKAISNAFYLYKKRTPFIHHFTYNNKRKIKTIFWHPKLENGITYKSGSHK